MTATRESSKSAPIGVVACGGPMPGEVIDAIQGRGLPVFVLAIAEETDAAAFAHLPGARLSWSKYGTALKALKAAGVRDVIMVGRMTRPRLRDARPDIGFIKGIGAALKVIRAGGDDALLRAVVELFEPHGFRVVGINDVAPELLIGAGLLAGPKPTAADDSDIAIGMRIIDALGRFDIGQAVIVADGCVLAIEGAEGTDKTIARVAALRGARPVSERSGVLVKRPKPGQDLRVDLPTIGPDTISGVKSANLAGIAAEAGWVIAAQRAALIDTANAANVFVFGVEKTTQRDEAPHQKAFANTALYSELSKLPEKVRGDCDLGCRVLETLLGHGLSPTLIVRRNRVITIGISETPLAALHRTYPARRGIFRAKTGVIIVGPDHMLTDPDIDAMLRVGIAACICVERANTDPKSSTAVEASVIQNGIALKRIRLAAEGLPQ